MALATVISLPSARAVMSQLAATTNRRADALLVMGEQRLGGLPPFVPEVRTARRHQGIGSGAHQSTRI